MIKLCAETRVDETGLKLFFFFIIIIYNNEQQTKGKGRLGQVVHIGVYCLP